MDEEFAKNGRFSEVIAHGIALRDALSGTTMTVKARAVINATGAWADALRDVSGARQKLRPLRGSHLVLPAWRLPVAQAVSLMHPLDRMVRRGLVVDRELAGIFAGSLLCLGSVII